MNESPPEKKRAKQITKDSFAVLADEEDKNSSMNDLNTQNYRELKINKNEPKSSLSPSVGCELTFRFHMLHGNEA